MKDGKNILYHFLFWTEFVTVKDDQLTTVQLT